MFDKKVYCRIERDLGNYGILLKNCWIPAKSAKLGNVVRFDGYLWNIKSVVDKKWIKTKKIK